MVAQLSFAIRVAVAAALILAAIWKLARHGKFVAAFSGMAPERLRVLARYAGFVVAAAETLLATLLVLGAFDHSLSAVGPAAVLLLLMLFSLIIIRAPNLEECGCWATPFVEDTSQARRLLLIRNGVLGAGALFILTVSGTVSGVPYGGALAGSVAGLVIVELPQIVAVSRYHRRWLPS